LLFQLQSKVRYANNAEYLNNFSYFFFIEFNSAAALEAKNTAVDRISF